MKAKKGLITLVLSLVLCFTMSTVAFASETGIIGEIHAGECGIGIVEDTDIMISPIDENGVMVADTIYYDTDRTITRSNSSSGIFYGDYYYSFTSSSITKLCLNVYMPNNSGTDYLQGTITLMGSDGTSSSPVQISNYSGDSWTLTFTGVKPNVNYYFYYQLYSVGASQKGYITSVAYVE